MRKSGFISIFIVFCMLMGFWLLSTGETQEVSKPTPVKVATPQRGKIQQDITYTGTLAADATVEIFANTSGKLVAVNVNNGATVKQADVLARTDARELQFALKQAESALKAAEANLSKVKATAEIRIRSQLETADAAHAAAETQLSQAEALAKAQVESAYHQAESGVKVALTNLQKAESGARNQEVEQAKAAVSAAKAGRETAEANFRRVAQLHAEEAISDKDFDTAKSQRTSAEAQHKSAVEQLSLVEEGAREEDRNAAAAQLAQAQAGLDLASVAYETQDWEKQIALAVSQVRQAAANLKVAEKNVSIRAWEHDIAAAEAQSEQAAEQVNLAKKRLADARITAPLNGIVVNRSADTGDYAAAAGSPSAKPILTLVKTDVLKAVFSVPETDMGTIAVGMPVRISTRARQRADRPGAKMPARSESLPEVERHNDDAGNQGRVYSPPEMQGNIRFISPIVNPEDYTVRVEAEIPNPTALLPGMFVEINLDLSDLNDALLLPRGAVLNIQDNTGHVFVATNGTAQQQSVKIGRVWGENISILEGVSDTTSVIVSGHRQLTDGADIRVVK